METSLLNYEIQYFLHISRAKTFLSAAESLGISQPALSRAMSRLEDQLGFKVLRRSRTGIELTAQGQELLERLRSVHENIDFILKNIRDRSEDLTGEIRLSGHKTVLQDFLIPHYPKLVKEFPLLRFHIEACSSRETIRKILNHDVDIGIAINPIEYSNLMFRSLRQTRGYFYSEIKKPTRYYLNPQMIDMNKLLRALKKRFLNESHIHFIEDYDLIAELVKNRMGCGLLPDHVGQRFALKQDDEISEIVKMNFELRLVVSSESLDDKKRKVVRFLENVLKNGPN